jgi:hypothetical protein
MRMGRREPNLQRTLDSTQKQEDLSQIFLLPPNEKEARKEASTILYVSETFYP